MLLNRRFSLCQVSIAETRKALAYFMSKYDVEKSVMDDVGLAVTEYLTNLLRHSAGLDHQLNLSISLETSYLHVSLLDKTQFFDLNQHINPWQLDCDELVTGGMGVTLIQQLLPEFEHHTSPGFNTFSFKVPCGDKRKKVLLLEDSESENALVTAYLEDDYQVTSTKCISDAVSALRRQQFALLVSDFNLPDGNVLDLLRGHDDLCHSLPVIIISGSKDTDLIRHANRFAICDFLIKPVNKANLLLSADRALQRGELLFKGFSAPSKITHQQAEITLFGSVCLGDGGDVFIYQECQESIRFILLDIMGHGAKAKQISLFLQGVLSALLAEPHSLKSLVTSFHSWLNGNRQMRSTMLTMVVAEVTQHNVHFINLGQPLPIAITKSATLKELGTGQGLLHLLSIGEYEVETFSLTDVENLVFVTDGVFENLAQESLLPHLHEFIGANDIITSKQLWRFLQPKLSSETDDASMINIQF